MRWNTRSLAIALALIFIATAFGGLRTAMSAPSGHGAFAFDQAYAQYVEETLVGMGSWPGYGFRVAGTPADNAAASFVAAQMKSLGLSDVRKEAVPVDAWNFKGASLQVTASDGTAETFVASSMGGVPGTPKDGLTGEIVYVGRGTPQEYPAGGVAGKLLLVDWDADWFWVNLVANQATLDGAKGVIISTMNHPSYFGSPDSLGSFDATYNDEWVPLIVISRNDGFALMDLMARGPVTGTMTSDVKLTLAENGGTGYNVVGVLRGDDHEHPILILGHHDAWFYGASDDTSSMAAMLGWVKGLEAAGVHPAHDLYFIATTGEEYGNTDAYYEWLVGAWYMITQAHPDWAERAIAFVNLEGLGGIALDGSIGAFAATSSPQLAGLVRQVFGASRDLLPYGWSVTLGVNSWTDGFTLTAAGMPGITVGTDIAGYDAVYHTNQDDLRFVNYPEMAREVSVLNRYLVALDAATVLPYLFLERALDLARSVNPTDFTRVGVNAKDLDAGIDQFRSLAQKYDRIQAGLPAATADQANGLLMQASYLIDHEWTALDCWDGTIYPTQQVEWDATWLTDGLAFLKAGNLNRAVYELVNVGLTWNAFFDYPVWKYENDRHAPGAEHLNWGAQGHLAPYVDIYAAYVSLLAKSQGTGPQDVAWETAALNVVLLAERTELQQRVDAETGQVAQINAILSQLIGMAG